MNSVFNKHLKTFFPESPKLIRHKTAAGLVRRYFYLSGVPKAKMDELMLKKAKMLKGIEKQKIWGYTVPEMNTIWYWSETDNVEDVEHLLAHELGHIADLKHTKNVVVGYSKIEYRADLYSWVVRETKRMASEHFGKKGTKPEVEVAAPVDATPRVAALREP